MVLDPFLTVPDILNMGILCLLCQGSFVLNFVVIRDIHFIIVFLLNDIIDIKLISSSTCPILTFYTFPESSDQMLVNGEEKRSRFDGLHTIIWDIHFVMKVFQRFKTQTEC